MYSEKQCFSKIVDLFDTIFTCNYSRAPRAPSHKHNKVFEVKHGEQPNYWSESRIPLTNKKHGLKSRNISFKL